MKSILNADHCLSPFALITSLRVLLGLFSHGVPLAGGLARLRA
jgi:hypothetical protein